MAEAQGKEDESFTPSDKLLNAASAEAIMEQVDGPSLTNYDNKEATFVGKRVVVKPGGKIEVPINVTAPGSVVQYTVESKGYDIALCVKSTKEGTTNIVRKLDRLNSDKKPAKGKFLVTKVPCLINFEFNNEYSWMREKQIQYRITVSPPSVSALQAGRRRRAVACQEVVETELKVVKARWDKVSAQKTALEEEVVKIEQELKAKKMSLDVASKEETWLKTRVELRTTQDKLLTQRLTEGWKDYP